METWEIAKLVLLDDGFRKLYPNYVDATRMLQTFKNYWKVDLTTIPLEELTNMNRKLHRCENLARTLTRAFKQFDFDYFLIETETRRIDQEWRRRRENRPRKKSSKAERVLAAKANRGNGKSKNR